MSHRCVVEKRTRLPWSRHFAATSCCRSISFSATSDRRERTSPASRRSRTKIIVARYQQDEGAAEGRCSRRESRTEQVASTGCNLRFFFESVRYSEDIDLDVTRLPVHTWKEKVAKILGRPALALPLKS